jgi:WD40 repeat protein
VYSANKELQLAAKKMTPSWPDKAFNLRHSVVRRVAFSPSGSQLAFCMRNRTGQDVIHIWDRWGKETLLEGYTGYIYCMEYSLDGEHLASGNEDGLIRIWHTESFHTNPSHPHMERPTRTPKQADTILVGRHSGITALSFSRTDSNLLASGGSNGEITVWNVKEQACIHSFNPRRGSIHSLFVAGGAGINCIAAAQQTGSIIRLWRAEGASDFASETMGEANLEGWYLRDAVFSPSGSFLATRFDSRTRPESTLALCELETMTKTVVMPGFTADWVAVSPDSKQLVVGDDDGRIRLIQTDTLSTQRALRTTGKGKAVCCVAFDPTCRVLAFGCHGGLELRSL